jgi:hypothetical protein
LERREESLVHFIGTVQSQTVDTVIRDEVGDPTLECAQHIRVLCSQIRKGDGIISFPAHLDARSVAVVNEAEGMIIRFLPRVSTAYTLDREIQTELKGVKTL